MNKQEIIDAYQRLDEALVMHDFEVAQKEIDSLYEEQIKKHQDYMGLKEKIEALRPKSSGDDKFINQINRIIEKSKTTLEDLMDTSMIIKFTQNFEKIKNKE